MSTITRAGHELPPGPWADEPDKEHWIDESTDLDCLIVRGPIGALCGYVGVGPGHPLYGKNYDDCTESCGDSCWEHAPSSMVTVHGGLTYSAKCQEDDPHGICHVPLPGREPDMWWFGFDCGHAGDLVPGMDLGPETRKIFADYTYRDFSYVKEQVTLLALQLAAVKA